LRYLARGSWQYALTDKTDLSKWRSLGIVPVG
jgi:hypothetical protein